MATLGGQWAIVAGDFVQALMLMPIAIVTAVVAWTKAGGWDGLSAGLPAGHFDLTAAGVSGFGPWWVVAILLDKFFIQNALHGAGRYLNVRDGRDARKAAFLAAGLFTLGSIVWFVPPLAARAMGIDLAARFPGLNQPAEAAYVAVASDCLPVGVLGLMVTGIVSATLSSMDHGLNRNAGVFVRSVYVPLFRPQAGEREQVLAGRIATLAFGGIVILTALMYTTWKNLGVFNLMLGFSALLGVPYAVPMVWCVLIRRVPDWAAWSAVFAGVTVGAAIGSAQTWIGWLGVPPDGMAARLASWAGQNHYVAVTMGGALASTLWFFGASALFGRTVTAERLKRIDEFFTTMRTPVPPESIETAETDAMGTAGIGRLCLACAGFCALLLLLPNGMMGRLAIVFCTLFIGLAGWGLVRASRHRARELARSSAETTPQIAAR
jgi:Na+/proline symporter